MYSRITGYYRPVRNWNDGKVSEFQNRKTYNTEQVRIDRENKLEADAEVSAKVAVATDAAKKVSAFPKTAELPDKQMMDAAKNLSASIMNSSASSPAALASNGKRYLISTHTCPNCNMVKKMLQEAHVEYTPLFAEEAEGAEMAKKFNICAVPTLIDETGNETKLLYNVNEIKTYIERLQ